MVMAFKKYDPEVLIELCRPVVEYFRNDCELPTAVEIWDYGIFVKDGYLDMRGMYHEIPPRKEERKCT